MKGKSELVSLARKAGVVLADAHLDLFEDYLKELLEWDKKMNLTGLSSVERIVRELLLDSLVPVPHIPEKGFMLDVGSGAGFPAIPIKVCRPRLTVHLVEAGARRVSFLKQVIRLTGLQGIRAIRGRIERDTGLVRAQGYDVVTFRALAPMPRAVLWCCPHLRPGGLMISFQGPRYENVLKESSEILEKEGLILEKRIPYKLPGKADPRNILLFRKTA